MADWNQPRTGDSTQATFTALVDRPESPVAVTWITADNGEARALSEKIVKSGLAACVNIVPTVESVYTWQGKTEVDEEALLMVKTRTGLLPDLTRFVKDHHSYDVPETIAAQIIGGNSEYLRWLHDQTKTP